ncbi:MAG: polyprenyl synthetase family protein [Candidatus Schekmanbacteria bacterium]|nr:MAG: polyprenyl synthetase family protein [Candidatus Schekmanbacteria bacterium]
MLDLFTPIKQELETVEDISINTINSSVDMINDIGAYISRNGGKRLRPALVILSSKACGNYSRSCINLACAVEYIHVATLLHDDVIDNANMRRGAPSANIKWGNKASILVGDYLFAKSFSIMVEEGNQQIMDSLANASMKMAEGEIQQLISKYDINMKEKKYIEIITKKTAELIASCCEVGALLANAPKKEVKAMYAYGLNIGIAFQLIDDALDFIADDKKLGKPICNDIHEGKVTLPLIKILEYENGSTRCKIEEILKKEKLAEHDIHFVMELINKYHTIDYTISLANRYASLGKEYLKAIPESKEKNILEKLADFIVKREV